VLDKGSNYGGDGGLRRGHMTIKASKRVPGKRLRRSLGPAQRDQNLSAISIPRGDTLLCVCK
jgi:hypothetical protein